MRIMGLPVVLIMCGCLHLLATVGLAGNEADAIRPLLEKLLQAVQGNDYAAFVGDGTAEFKSGLPPQMLAGVSAQLGPRMAAGYAATYLGLLVQQGCRVYLWKLVFTDGGDDVLAKLALVDDQVAGFWLQ